MTNKTRTSICTTLTDGGYTANMYLCVRSLRVLYYLGLPSAPLDTDYKEFWDYHDE